MDRESPYKKFTPDSGNSPTYQNYNNSSFNRYSPKQNNSPRSYFNDSDFIYFGYGSPQNSRVRQSIPKQHAGSNSSSNSFLSNHSGFNGSPYNSFNRSNKFTPYKKNRGNGRLSCNRVDISEYWDPSCLEDPWAELEKSRGLQNQSETGLTMADSSFEESVDQTKDSPSSTSEES